MKRTLPIASHPAAFASTLPPTSDNVMTIPSDISSFMTVLLFPGPVHETHYTTSDGVWPKVPVNSRFMRTTRPRLAPQCESGGHLHVEPQALSHDQPRPRRPNSHALGVRAR